MLYKVSIDNSVTFYDRITPGLLLVTEASFQKISHSLLSLSSSILLLLLLLLLLSLLILLL